MEFYDLKTSRGGSFIQELRFRQDGLPMDLTGYTGYSQVRPTPESETLICEMTVTITGEEGKAVLSIPKEITAGIEPGNYAYDFCLDDPDGNRTYFIGGAFIVCPTVTKEGE